MEIYITIAGIYAGLIIHAIISSLLRRFSFRRHSFLEVELIDSCGVSIFTSYECIPGSQQSCPDHPPRHKRKGEILSTLDELPPSASPVTSVRWQASFQSNPPRQDPADGAHDGAFDPV